MNIGLIGRFGSGKSTLSRQLQDEYDFVPVAMATNLKNTTASVYGTLDKGQQVETTTEDGEVVLKSIRAILQELGQAVKVVDRDMWLKWMIRDSEDYVANGYNLVMDDLRYPFEADALRDDWFLVRLEIPDDVRLQRYFAAYGRYPTHAELNHSSETELDNIEVDLVLAHDGHTAPEVLAEQILSAMGVIA